MCDRIRFGSIVILFLLSWVAFGAQVGTVALEGAEVFESPKEGAAALEKLAKGAAVTASNEPSDGFYKVRTELGAIGFVKQEALKFAPPPVLAPTPAASASATPSAPPGEEVLKLKVFYGSTLFSVTSVNQFLSRGGKSFSGLSNGVQTGVEISFRLAKSLALLIRGEKLSRSLLIRDTSTRYLFELEASSTPILVGVDLRLYRALEDRFTVGAGVLGGVGLQTQLSLEAMSLPAPTLTRYTDTTLTGMGRLDAHIRLLSFLGVFVEGGYRWLQTGPLQPTTKGNGGEVFQTSGGVYSDQTLDLSGLFGSAGVSVFF